MENHIRYPEIDPYIRSSLREETGVLKEMETYAREHFVPIVPPETAAFLKIQVRIKRPFRILEAGTAIGYSAAVMAGAMPDGGILDSIEMDENMVQIASKNLIRLGLEKKVRILRGEALEVMQCLSTPYDMIFLDASKGEYLQYLNECKRLLPKGGLLIADNILYKGLVAQTEPVPHKHRTIAVNLKAFIQELCHDDQWDTDIIPMGDGLVISYRK